MKFLPENLGDERLIRLLDYSDGDILADISLLASIRRREGAPLESILLGAPSFELLRARLGRPKCDAMVVELLGGSVCVGIDPDDVETPLPSDPERPYRP